MDEILANRIYLSSPTIHEEEMKFIQEAFDKNWIAPLGQNVDKFETELARYGGIDYAVALSSGTAAIHLALKLAGVKDGDTVFCPSLTFVASANPIIYERATPVFIDSERDSWNMDPKSLEYAFEHCPLPKAVMLVHLYGTPAKIEEIVSLCRKYNVPLIEDAAESLGATYHGIQTGSFGDFGILSFNGNKIITTSGGGALLTDSKEMAAKAKFLATQARENEVHYEHKELGYNYRLSNISAGIGRGQLIHLDEHVTSKRRIYDRYKEGLKGLPLNMNPFLMDTFPNHWLSCVLLDDDCSVTSSDLRIALERFNIESRPIWKPMHLQPLYKDCLYISLYGDVSKDIFERGFCLPSDIKMTEEEQQKIIAILRETIEGGCDVSKVL